MKETGLLGVTSGALLPCQASSWARQIHQLTYKTSLLENLSQLPTLLKDMAHLPKRTASPSWVPPGRDRLMGPVYRWEMEAPESRGWPESPPTW